MSVTLLLRVVPSADVGRGVASPWEPSVGTPSKLSGWSGSILVMPTTTSDRADAQDALAPTIATAHAWVPPTWEEIVEQHSARDVRGLVAPHHDQPLPGQDAPQAADPVRPALGRRRGAAAQP